VAALSAMLNNVEALGVNTTVSVDKGQVTVISIRVVV
jgi:hypothetical protein